MPDPKFAEGWDLPTGGFLDDTDITIQLCTFEFRGDVNDGKSMLAIMHYSRDDNGEVGEQRYSVGGDWLSPDGGATIESKRSKLPSKQSNYGKFCEAVKSIPELFEVVANRGPVTQASIWDGVKVHMKAFENTFKIRGETEPRTFTTILPVAYNGLDGTGAGNTPAQPSIPPQQPAITTKTPQQILAEAQANQSVAATDPRQNDLAVLAKGSGDHATFLAQALNRSDAQEIMADEALLADLMNEGPAGFFIRNH